MADKTRYVQDQVSPPSELLNYWLLFEQVDDAA